MSDDTRVAYERARDLVGATVWEKLQNSLRGKIIDAEMSSLATNRDPDILSLSSGARSPQRG